MCKSEPIGTVISRELKDRNVSRYRIVTDTLSNNTYEQLEVIKKNMPSHWKVAIISNEWHLPRVNYFAQRLKLKVDLLSAESILFDYDYDLWHPIIEDIRKDKKTQKRIKTEKQKVTEFEKSPRR